MQQISLVDVKKWARNRFVSSHPFRVSVESQPDSLPVSDFVVLLIAWDRLLTGSG
jgi:hypothetical protein